MVKIYTYFGLKNYMSDIAIDHSSFQVQLQQFFRMSKVATRVYACVFGYLLHKMFACAIVRTRFNEWNRSMCFFALLSSSLFVRSVHGHLHDDVPNKYVFEFCRYRNEKHCDDGINGMLSSKQSKVVVWIKPKPLSKAKLEFLTHTQTQKERKSKWALEWGTDKETNSRSFYHSNTVPATHWKPLLIWQERRSTANTMTVALDPCTCKSHSRQTNISRMGASEKEWEVKPKL